MAPPPVQDPLKASSGSHLFLAWQACAPPAGALLREIHLEERNGFDEGRIMEAERCRACGVMKRSRC